MVAQLFTFICEIGGGTYIAQASGSNVEDAVRKWALQIPHEIWAGNLAERVSAKVIDDLEGGECPPTPLEGVSGVWCVTGLIDDSSFFINIVETVWTPDVGGE